MSENTSLVIDQIQRHRLLPVIILEDADQAAPLAEALVEGGLPVAEVTFRTAAAADSIRRMAARNDLLVGAGTVLTTEQVDQAFDAGAKFIVSPGTNPTVINYCIERDIPITPGVATPSDIERALECGVKTLKFFPAEAIGGLKTLKAVAAPYGMCRFIPTGGITRENLGAYLSFPKTLACGGSWMVAPDLLKRGDFDTIRKLVTEAVEAVKAL